MRYALASVGLHAGLIAGAYLLMQLEPPAEATSAESVAVDILSVETFTNTEASEVVTEATQTLVSAGMDSASEPVPEVIEVAAAEPLPDVTEMAKPVMAQPIEATKSDELISAEVLTATAEAPAPVESPVPQVMDSAAAAVADTARPAEVEPLPEVPQAAQPLTEPVEPAEPVEVASLEPQIEEIAETMPVPLPRIKREVVEEQPEPEKPKEARKPAEKPKEKPVEKKPAKQASLGNGGEADADSAASKAAGGKGKKNSGGEASAEDYRGLVRSKVMRAVRQPKGKFTGGEVRIMFTLDANGRVLSASLSKSSGDPKVDDAVFAAVKRAAPFPPFPEGTGKSTWSFTFPVLITN